MTLGKYEMVIVRVIRVLEVVLEIIGNLKNIFQNTVLISEKLRKQDLHLLNY
mgnify:CR=1 FL=1